jgi:hypothetical protein
MGRVLRMTCCISKDRGLCTVEMEEMLVSTGMYYADAGSSVTSARLAGKAEVAVKSVVESLVLNRILMLYVESRYEAMSTERAQYDL